MIQKGYLELAEANFQLEQIPVQKYGLLLGLNSLRLKLIGLPFITLKNIKLCLMTIQLMRHYNTY